jgi:hypothetical protein
MELHLPMLMSMSTPTRMLMPRESRSPLPAPYSPMPRLMELHLLMPQLPE